MTALRRSFPAEGYFAGSAVFHYLGPAFAVLLFAHVGVLGVAWLRIASAAVVFAAWRRPWRWYARLGRSEQSTVVALGLTLAVMNACFYLAIDRLPLGTVAAIEFLGPTIVAAAGMRTRRNQLALLLVVCGVYLVTGCSCTASDRVCVRLCQCRPVCPLRRARPPRRPRGRQTSTRWPLRCWSPPWRSRRSASSPRPRR